MHAFALLLISMSTYHITIISMKTIDTKSSWYIYRKRNASNTPSNTYFSTNSFWLVKIHMGPTKSCGSHMNLVGPLWISIN